MSNILATGAAAATFQDHQVGRETPRARAGQEVSEQKRSNDFKSGRASDAAISHVSEPSKRAASNGEKRSVDADKEGEKPKSDNTEDRREASRERKTYARSLLASA